MRASERGFTLIEVLIASAITSLMALTGLAACKAVAGVEQGLYAAGHDATAIDAQAAQLRDDAASSFAVFVPATDMRGAPNRDAGGGHEVDYYAKSDAGQAFLWRYFYDSAQQTLQRFDYDPDGTSGVRDRQTGRIDQTAAYPIVVGIAAFDVRNVSADELGDSARNPYGGIAQMFDHTPRAFGVDYARPGLDIPDAIGGNAVVQIRIANATAARIVHLTAGSLPTGFTITGLPRWHAIIYRVDQTHRSSFGIVGKSHVFINARIDVTYDDWVNRTGWCDFNVLGNPDGLDGDDPHANYTPKESVEQAETLLAQCRRIHPTPPPRGALSNPPEPGVVRPQPPGPPPPACWTNPGPLGRCWPPDAPVDWSPPSPLPIDPPPRSWCAAHAESNACSAPAGARGRR